MISEVYANAPILECGQNAYECWVKMKMLGFHFLMVPGQKDEEFFSVKVYLKDGHWPKTRRVVGRLAVEISCFCCSPLQYWFDFANKLIANCRSLWFGQK